LVLKQTIWQPWLSEGSFQAAKRALVESSENQSEVWLPSLQAEQTDCLWGQILIKKRFQE
jgi:hypothetical protein